MALSVGDKVIAPMDYPIGGPRVIMEKGQELTVARVRGIADQVVEFREVKGLWLAVAFEKVRS